LAAVDVEPQRVVLTLEWVAARLFTVKLSETVGAPAGAVTAEFVAGLEAFVAVPDSGLSRFYAAGVREGCGVWCVW